MEVYVYEKIMEALSKMTEQLTDLQNKVAALEAQLAVNSDLATQAMVLLQSLLNQMAALRDDPVAIAALATKVQADLDALTAKDGELAAALAAAPAP